MSVHPTGMDQPFETQGVTIPLIFPDERQPLPISAARTTRPQTPSPKPEHSSSAQRLPQPSTTQPKRPLRPAHHILSRLRHDPAYNIADFVIGYHDRHEPESIEISALDWGGDSTDEEWIPMHRVAYFRYRDGYADGERQREGEGGEGDGAAEGGGRRGRKVWDRQLRLDRVFGSGRGDSTHEKEDKDVAVSAETEVEDEKGELEPTSKGVARQNDEPIQRAEGEDTGIGVRP